MGRDQDPEGAGRGHPHPSSSSPALSRQSSPPLPSYSLPPTGPLSGAPEALCPGHAGPPWGCWEFLHSALPVGTLGGGALESGLHGSGSLPCPGGRGGLAYSSIREGLFLTLLTWVRSKNVVAEPEWG